MPDDMKQFTEADLEDTAFKVTVLTRLQRIKPIEEKLDSINGRCAERLEMIHSNEVEIATVQTEVKGLDDNMKFWRKVIFIILGIVGSLSIGIGGLVAYMKVINGG